MHIYLINEEGNSKTWKWHEGYNNDDFHRWMESPPVSPPPKELLFGSSLNMSFEWKNQGWGHRKGQVEIDLLSPTGQVLATERTAWADRVNLHWTHVDLTFNENSDLLSRLVSGSYFRVKITVGSGGGHTLTIKNFKLRILFNAMHEAAFSKEELIKELDIAQRAMTNMDAKDLPYSKCQLALGFVVYDCILLAIGGTALRASATNQIAAGFVEVVLPIENQLMQIIARIAAPNATNFQCAKAVFDLLSTIWTGGFLGGVVGVFLKSLNWWKATLYAATTMATIVFALATDGTSFVAEVVILLLTFAWLVTDSANAIKQCT